MISKLQTACYLFFLPNKKLATEWELLPQLYFLLPYGWLNNRLSFLVDNKNILYSISPSPEDLSHGNH